MDTFTQIALGATIAEAGFRPRLGRRAVVWGGLCGALPDADVAIGLVDRWASLMYHRSFSHSLLVLTVLAFGMGLLGHRFGERQGRAVEWMHLSFWGLVTHPLLDVCTPYGTQLFWPLRDTRFAVDAVNVVDPIYSLPLFVLTFLALRTATASVQRTGAAAALLVVTTLYLGVGWLAAGRARHLATEELVARGIEPVEVRALPTWLNNQAFRVLARDAHGDVHVGHVSVLVPRPIAFERMPAVHDARAERALASERGRQFQWFAMGWAVPIEPPDGPPGELLLADARYATITEPLRSFFTARVRFGPDGALVSVERRDDPRVRASAELASLRALVLGW